VKKHGAHYYVSTADLERLEQEARLFQPPRDTTALKTRRHHTAILQATYKEAAG
jgi:hypothetical protein